MKKLFLIIVIVLMVFIIGLLVTIRIRHGGGREFEDRSSSPRLPSSALEIVAALEQPPGNIAVSATGRIFISIHPLSRPEKLKVVELIGGQPVCRTPTLPHSKICFRPSSDWPLTAKIACGCWMTVCRASSSPAC